MRRAMRRGKKSTKQELLDEVREDKKAKEEVKDKYKEGKDITQ